MKPIQFCIALTFAMLATASGVTYLLRLKNPGSATIRKVMTIVKSWWIIAAIFLGGLALGRWGVLALFLILNVAAICELLKFSQIGFRRRLGVCLIAAVIPQYMAMTTGSLLLFMTVPVVAMILVVPMTVVLTNSVSTLPTVAAMTMGVLTLSHFLSYIPAIAWLQYSTAWPEADQELLAIAMLFLLTEANDVLQFLIGKMFGRRRPLPTVSPNKTSAGFLGGLVLTPCLAMATLSPLLGVLPWSALTIGLCVAYVGILGDLLFSAVKRYFNTKDFSDLLPGHGGILDRMDSLVLTAPVYFHLLNAFRTHTL